jgi:phage gp36-like protein
MSVYATLADLIDRFGERELVELTDDAQAGSVDEALIARAIGSAESMIDGYLAARHQLPLSVVPRFLADAACDIARFKLWRTSPPELVQKNFDAAIAVLNRIADGKIRLDQGVATEAARAGAIIVNDPGRTFSRETLKGF